MTGELILYGTEHCTLCDQALEMLFSMPELAGLSVRVVDVALDEALLARFGEELPVLELTDATGRTISLGWPFEPSEILLALGQREQRSGVGGARADNPIHGLTGGCGDPFGNQR